MPEQDLVASQIAELLRTHASTDIVVGLPSYDNAETVSDVVRAIRQGLAQRFPESKAIIISVDGGSTDATPARLAELQAEAGTALVQVRLPGREFIVPYHGIPRKGEALHATLEVARQTGARVCLMLSPDVVLPTSSVLEQLAAPVLLEGFDLALPLYLRHKFDGAITSCIVRPLVRALYGRRVQQPMGAEYALSAGLVERCLAQNVWGTDLARLGSDIWTTTQAMCGAFKICHVQLGLKNQARNPARTTAPVDLSATVSQVLGSLFDDMIRNAQVWQRVRGSLPIKVLGLPVDGAAPLVSFDFHKLVESFALGLRNLQDVWALVLAPATLLELHRAAALPPDRFTLPDLLWCRVLFDFSLGYRLRTMNRSHLLAAFLPLYLGWLGGFVREMQDATDSEAERRIEQLCRTYESDKPYLISRWRSPDRFNP
jgi:glucosylglycerate synthase